MAGRRSIRTADNRKAILDALALGSTINDACAYAGISNDTFGRWRDGDTDFADAIKKAQAQARVVSIGRIRKAGNDGNWTADAWFLERSDPAHWGRRDTLKIEGGLSVELVNQAARALTDAGLDPAQVFNDLIREAVNAKQTVGESGDSAADK